MQPDGFRLGDEITDGEYHALADENSVAGPLGAQRLRGEGIGGNDGPPPPPRGPRSLAIKSGNLPPGPGGQRHPPIARGRQPIPPSLPRCSRSTTPYPQ